MHKYHYILATFFLFSYHIFFAQNNETRWKINASTLVGFPGAAFEKQISKNKTFQVDALLSPWKSYLGNDLLFGILSTELRFYRHEAFKGFYFGPNFGFTTYHLQKWNYSHTKYTQRGFSFLYGATVGYQFKLRKKWLVDLYIGGGHVQSFYKGYDKNTNLRVDSATHYNKSGEFIPYKLGVMITYPFR